MTLMRIKEDRMATWRLNRLRVHLLQKGENSIHPGTLHECLTNALKVRVLVHSQQGPALDSKKANNLLIQEQCILRHQMLDPSISDSAQERI